MDIRVDGKWPVRLEVALGVQPGLPVADWIWTDITEYCFKGSQPAPIQITYGRQDGMSETQPAAMTTTLDNQDGRFTPGNVTSPLWPYWKRGLPIRARLDGLNLGGMEVRDVPNVADSWAETPDHSSFAVTDLDVRIDITPQSWRPSHGLREVLAGQYDDTANDQRAWYVAITNGVPELTWSANGVANVGTVAATVAVPATSGRLTLRTTLDVNNGAAGRTITFYTGPSVDGPWTQLGAPVTQAGVTSIFNSFVPLEVGSADGGGAIMRAFTGTIHRFRLCAAINGAAVADADFGAVNPGAETFTDSTGRMWTVHGYARVTDPAVRYCGQLAEIAPTWPYGELDGEGESQVSITAAGLLRRIGQGASPLQSSMRRGLTTNPKPPVAYWPCEEGKSATVISSASGGPSMTFTGAPLFAANTDFACSEPLPELNNSVWTGLVPGYADINLQSQSRFLLSIPADGEAAANNGVIFRVHTTGTAARWDVMYGNGFGGILGLKIYDPAGNLIHDGTLFDFDMNGQPCRIGVTIGQDGANVLWFLAVIKVPDDINDGEGSADSGTLFGRTAGVVNQVTVNPAALFKESAVGHVSVNREWASGFDMLAELGAWAGEISADRFSRLCAQQRIARWVSPGWKSTEPLGRQRVDTLPALIGESVAADMAVHTETLDTLGLHYRARVDLYDQEPIVTLDAAADWGHIVNPFAPVDDDQAIRNDVEVSRVDGSSVRVTDDDHIAEHGRYDEQTTVNVHRDGQLLDIAGWRLHLGTWPGMRYPELSPALDAHPELAAEWIRIRAGDLVRVIRLPRQHPPGPVELLVQGWSESISPNFWAATANTTAAGPWDTGHASDATDPDPDRADTAGCVTATGAAPGDHLIYAATTKGPLWTDSPAEMPLPLRVDGDDVQIDTVDRSLWDFFSGRTVTNGWGTSTNGIPWTIAGGAAADYSVDGGFGRMSLTDRGNNRFALSALAVDQTHVSLQFVGHISVNPTGGNILVCGNIRMADFNNFVMCRIVFMPGNVVFLDVVRRFNGTETLIGFTSPLSISTGADIGARIEAHGTALRARIWQFDPSGDEPTYWMITGTDPTPKQGQVAVWSRTETNNTNTLPVTTSWFQVALDNPQKLTLPAGPGFHRAHPIGRDIRLTRPATVAW